MCVVRGGARGSASCVFSAEMSVSLIYLCSGRWVPGKQRAQRVWESPSNPEQSRRRSSAHRPLQRWSPGIRGEGGILGASDKLGFPWLCAQGLVPARRVRHQQQRHKEGDTGLPVFLLAQAEPCYMVLKHVPSCLSFPMCDNYLCLHHWFPV